MSEDTSMEARYALELKDRDPSTIEDLILNDCQATKISGIDDKLVNLTNLSLVGIGLTSLEGLPKLPKLTKLDLANNKLTGDLGIIAENCPEILHVNLSSNEIKDISALEGLKASKSIAEIDLFSNEIDTEDSAVREEIFKMFTNLQILDGCDINGEEVEEDDISIEDESGEDVDDEEEGPGLSYLDNSQLDEDESEDFEPDVKGRGKKRGNPEAGDSEEPAAKKEAS